MENNIKKPATLSEIRQQTLEKIINSPDNAGVEFLINNCIEKLRQHNVHDFLILRLLSNLEASLKEIQTDSLSMKSKNNINKAINILHKPNLNKDSH